jgi:hypothetical protein
MGSKRHTQATIRRAKAFALVMDARDAQEKHDAESVATPRTDANPLTVKRGEWEKFASVREVKTELDALVNAHPCVHAVGPARHDRR